MFIQAKLFKQFLCYGTFIFSFFCIEVAAMDIKTIVEKGLQNDPMLNEQRSNITGALLKKKALQDAVILPEFEISCAAGPVPGYSVSQDASGSLNKNYDFFDLDAALWTEIKIVQPLNIKRLRKGIEAADGNIELSTYDVRKAELAVSQNMQELCYKYLYAFQMKRFAYEVKSNLEKAIAKADSLLAEDNQDISQEDVFELKTYVFKADDGLYDAQAGLSATQKAIMFSSGLDSFTFDDTVLHIRNERIPSFDTLSLLLKHFNPDIKRLASGIKIQNALVNLSILKMFPDAFVAGSCSLLRTNQRDKHTGMASLTDPFNKTDAALGIGLRFSLNYWSARNEYQKKKLELQRLQDKQDYAQQGLLLHLENQYLTVQTFQKKTCSAKNELRVTQSWLNSALMKYDMDPSNSRQLLKAYEKFIQANKDYYENILKYNNAVAVLISMVGMTLSEYHDCEVSNFILKEKK